MRASPEALSAIAAAFAERSAIILFNECGMRNTEEAKLFMWTKARQILVATGVPAHPPHALSWTPNRIPAAVAAYAATGVSSVYKVLEDDHKNDNEHPPLPPPAAPLAVAALPREANTPPVPAQAPAVELAEAGADGPARDGPVAVAPGEAAPSINPGSNTSPRCVHGAAGTGPPRSGGGKAQLTKDLAAAEEASRPLGTTFPLAIGDTCDRGLSAPSGRASTPLLRNQSSSESDEDTYFQFVQVACVCVQRVREFAAARGKLFLFCIHWAG